MAAHACRALRRRVLRDHLPRQRARGLPRRRRPRPTSEMAAVARWTNLSETTFLCAPTDPGRRLPRAHLDHRRRAALRRPPDPRQRARVARGRRRPGIRRRPWCRSAVPAWSRCAAAAAAAVRRPAADPLRAGRARPTPRGSSTALGLDPADVVDLAWVDNGPGWVGVLLRSPDAVLAADPDPGRVRRPQGRAGRRLPAGRPGRRGRAPRCGPSTPTGATSPRTRSPAASTPGWPSGSSRPGTCPSSYVAAQGTRHRPRGTGARRRRRRHGLGRRGDPHRRHRRAAPTDLAA